jgi:Holliday junction DNA helicase RuvA
MIDRLSGRVIGSRGTSVVVDVGGVGFRLEVSAGTQRDLGGPGSEAIVFTHLHVREDALQLFGFSTQEERALFQLLISVSKVGPRLALAALSARRPGDLVRAIALGDAEVFQAVPGIGKKTAERLILELRDKIEGTGGTTATGGGAVGIESLGDDNLLLARAALLELGLSAGEADQALRDADPEEQVQSIITRAIQKRRHL